MSSAVPAASESAPLTLTGTLDVKLNDAVTVINNDGSATTSVPVVGRLGNLGKVTGNWNHGIDTSGNLTGPDTLVLKSSRSSGSFTIEFNNNNIGQTAKSIGHGLSDFQHAQKLTSGTGTFAKSAEHGSIEMVLNTDKETYQSLILITIPTTTTA